MISLAGKLLMVVDDEPMLREVISDELKMAGAETFEESNGRRAFDALQSHQKTVSGVVTDVRMPGGDGIELLEKIRQANPKLPVLLITAYADLSNEDLYDKGADAVLGKPCEYEVLIEAVSNALLPQAEKWRVPISLEPDCYKLKIETAEFDAAVKNREFNLGRGGMFIATTGDLPALAELISFEIGFILNGQKTKIEGVGICRWIRSANSPDFPRGFGFEFKLIGEATAKILGNLMEANIRKAFIPKA